MKYHLNGTGIEAAAGDCYLKAVRAHFPSLNALGVRVGGETLPLTDAPNEGEYAEIITYDSAEGRLIYERSLRFVL